MRNMASVVATVVVVAILCLALAPCARARPLQPSSSRDSGLVIAKCRDESFRTRGFRNPEATDPGVERRSLKTSSGKGSKPKRSKPKQIKFGKGGNPTLLGVVMGVSIVVGIVLLCVVFVAVTEKREEDPNWRVRTFLRRKLKRPYTSKAGKAAKGDRELHVEKQVPEAGGLDTHPVKKVELADAN
jgi:hypothetical protein